MTYKQQVCCEI